MSTTATSASPVLETSAPADPLMGKVAKYLDAHQTKIRKLQDDNQKLRAQITELKSMNSRVRRIPKASTTAATPDTA